MNKEELLSKLMLFEKFLFGTKYEAIVKDAMGLFYIDEFSLCEQKLGKFPTNEQLLKELVNKLEGKSVCRTLEKIREGKTEGNLTELKGLLSLGTHVVIECENGNKEFMLLLPLITERINDIVYKY